MLDYDAEAATYDATRGGWARVRAAVEVVNALLPTSVDRLVDLGCGTGSVTKHLAAHARQAVGVDRSAAMTRYAQTRNPGSVVQGDVTRLPFIDSCACAVTAIWLLHLLVDAQPVVAEASRVLRIGGIFITTVDKNSAQIATESDLAEILRPYQLLGEHASDDSARIDLLAERCGLARVGGGSFTGLGQGTTPQMWIQRLHEGKLVGWARELTDEQIESLCASLAALPDQEEQRPEPIYRVAAYRKGP